METHGTISVERYSQTEYFVVRKDGVYSAAFLVFATGMFAGMLLMICMLLVSGS